MKENSPPAAEEPPEAEFTRFQRLARALFRVDKRDVPKHEPVKRARRNETESSATQVPDS